MIVNTDICPRAAGQGIKTTKMCITSQSATTIPGPCLSRGPGGLRRHAAGPARRAARAGWARHFRRLPSEWSHASDVGGHLLSL